MFNNLIIRLYNLSISDGCEDCFSPIVLNNTYKGIAKVYIELTSVCNNLCKGCGNVFVNDKVTRKTNNDAMLSISEWHNIIIDKLALISATFNITGGEPTLYRQFDEFITLLDECEVKFNLFTNARWHTPKRTVKTLHRLKGLQGLLISLHGKDATTHETFTRIAGSYNDTIRNIRLAVNAGISVTTNTIITRNNYSQIKEIYQLGQEIGVHKVSFGRYVGSLKNDCTPTVEQFGQALNEIEALRVSGASIRLGVATPQCFQASSALVCGAGKSFIALDPWGNVRPCLRSPLILGSLLSQSLEEIMASEKLHYWQSLIPEKCGNCSVFSFCGGGCRAQAILNRTPHDPLIQRPFSSEEKNDILMLPDNLHPVMTQEHPQKNVFDGSLTLKEIGIQYGQPMLDSIGVMYREGSIQLI